jgi:hypothetical protein
MAFEYQNPADALKAEQAGKDAKNKADLEKRFGGDRPTLQIGLNQYGELELSEVQYDANGQEISRTQKFFIVEPNGKDFGIYNGSQVIAKIKKLYSNQEALRRSLYDKGFISQKDYETKSEVGLNSGILKAANEHSVGEAQKYTVNGATSFAGFGNWFSKRANYGSGGGPEVSMVETPRPEADQDIDSFFNEMLGRDATAAEKNDYFERLQREEKKAKRTTTSKGGVSKTVDTLLTADDYYRIRTDVLKPSVAGTDLEKIAAGNGKIAQDISELKAYANSYGVRLDTKKALNEITAGMKPGSAGSLEAQKKSILEMSKLLYSNLAPQIDSGLKVADIAGQYAAYKSKILELPSESIDVFDNDIQAALRNGGKAGTMSYTDFEIAMRRDPRWSKTQNAREEASSYANSILKSFGLVG